MAMMTGFRVKWGEGDGDLVGVRAVAVRGVVGGRGLQESLLGRLVGAIDTWFEPRIAKGRTIEGFRHGLIKTQLGWFQKL
jgi:hypothetical protein